MLLAAMKTSELSALSSLNCPLSAEPAAFGFLEPANDALDDPAELRRRVEEDGYLYVKEFFDPELILAGRRSIMERLAEAGELDPDRDLMDGIVHPDRMEAFKLDAAPVFKEAGAGKRNPEGKAGAFRPDLALANAEIARVVFGPEICGFYETFFGGPIRHFDFIWLRLMGPGMGTPSHCDWVYMGRGSRRLMTCWIPYGDIPLEVGGLILLEQSHKQAHRIREYLGKDVDGYCENRPEEVEKVARDGKWSFPGWLSRRPDSLPSKFGARWLTAEEWHVGDFITFRMDLIHASLDNHSDRVRLSTDTRYQPADEPADERWIGPNPPGHGLAGKRGRIC